MNDQQEPAPDKGDDQPPADETPSKPPAGLGESTPVRAVSSAAAFAATCLIVATIAGAAAIAVKIIPPRGDGFAQTAVVTGFQALMRSWLAGLVAVVMTNSFLRGGRTVVVRRSGILGAVSGLLTVAILAMGLTVFEGRQLGLKIVNAMPYIVAMVALLICLSWRSGEERSAGEDEDEPSAKDADENDDKADEEDDEQDRSEE